MSFYRFPAIRQGEIGPRISRMARMARMEKISPEFSPIRAIREIRGLAVQTPLARQIHKKSKRRDTNHRRDKPNMPEKQAPADRVAKPIRKLMVANRSEIAIRVFR